MSVYPLHTAKNGAMNKIIIYTYINVYMCMYIEKIFQTFEQDCGMNAFLCPYLWGYGTGGNRKTS